MFSWKAQAIVAFGVGFLWLAAAHGQQPPASGKVLSAQDRTEIEQLLAHYARALSGCAAKEYAELFTPDGVFTSDDFRSAKHRELYGKSAKLVGRDKLAELVETEEFCLHPDGREARARTAGGNPNRPPVSPEIEATAEGAKGTVPLAGGGRYEDVYVKTSEGWRFKSRTVFMPPLSNTSRAAQPAPSK